MQLDLTPKRYVNLTYKSEFSLYDEEVKRHNLLAMLEDDRGDRLTIDYQRQLDRGGKTLLDEIDAKLGLKMWEGVSLNLRADYRLDTEEMIRSEVNLIVERQCWGVSISYADEFDDKRFAVGIKLYGVGELQAQTF